MNIRENAPLTPHCRAERLRRIGAALVLFWMAQEHIHCIGKPVDIKEQGAVCRVIHLGTEDDGASEADFAMRCEEISSVRERG